jgi:hypothetical protein
MEVVICSLGLIIENKNLITQKIKKIKNPVSPLMGPTKPIDVAHQAHPIVAAARRI